MRKECIHLFVQLVCALMAGLAIAMSLV